MKLKKVNTSIEQIVDVYKRLTDYYQQLNQITDSIKKAENDLSVHRQAVMDILHLKEFNLEKVSDLIYPQLWEELNTQMNLVEQLKEQIAALQKN